MATISTMTCTACDTTFGVTQGPTRTADNLACDGCGRRKLVSHASLGDAHLRYIKGLGRPWALNRAQADRFIQAHYPGEPLDRDGYEAAVEGELDPCACGGRFRYGAPARCTGCRATAEHWVRTPGTGIAFAC